LRYIALCVVLGTGSGERLWPSELMAAGIALGSSEFKASPERPVGWRGDGTGRFPGAIPPTKWSRTDRDGKPQSSNILWMLPVPAGASAPIVVGDKLFFGFDPYGLMAVSKLDGHVLWYRTHHFYEVLSEKERRSIEDKAKTPYAKMSEHLDAEIRRMSAAISPAGWSSEKRFMTQPWSQQLGESQKQLDSVVAEVDKLKYRSARNYWEWASATPVSDGKYVFMYFSHRVAVCYDLEGRRQWATVEPGEDLKGASEHGRHSSPVLAGDKFIAQYGNEVIAFDRKSGKLCWRKTLEKPLPWAPSCYSSLVTAVAGGQLYVVTSRGEGFRAIDGEPGWGFFKDYAGENTTAIVENDRIFLWDRAGLIQLHIPPNPGPSAHATEGKGIRAKYYMVASPLFVNGLVYFLENEGPLRVLDAETGALVYEKQLPLTLHKEYVFYPGYSASPALAGKYIYILDNQGGTLVLQPGREYKEIAINRIETFERKAREKDGKESTISEQFVSNPVFDGKQIFIRGQQYLYCIGSH
jgi:outer membrane protein assembly factor BamB